jgi:hypothetical protein
MEGYKEMIELISNKNGSSSQAMVGEREIRKRDLD